MGSADEVRALVDQLSADLPVSRDLTDRSENLRVLDLAAVILDSGLPIQEFQTACYGVAGKNAAPPVLVSAVGSAASKLKLRQCGPFHMQCIFAMYGEQNRIKQKSEHENGQDFIRMKVAQLQWLFDGEPASKTWELIAVDDGCPNDSKGLARAIIEAEGFDKVRVLDLEDAVRADDPFFIDRGLKAGCKQSRKGGAILHGLKTAAAAGMADDSRPQLVMYTDSDLSSDMSLCGELADGILGAGASGGSGGAHMSMGARYGQEGTFLVKPPGGGAVGHPQNHYEQPNMMKIVFRHYVRSRLLPMLANIYDTQCAFKCFRAGDLPPILDQVRSLGADFDMELLLCALTYYQQKDANFKLCNVSPTLFTEDFAESNFMASSSDPDKPYKTYAEMTTALIQMHERYVAPHNPEASAAVADLIAFGRDLDWQAYKRMITNLEAQLGPTIFDYDFGLDKLVEASRL